ncbi:MAG: sugar ABC transporter ATPase [Microbacterium sp.]
MTTPADDVAPQPVTDRDTTIEADDPAQAEWDRTTAIDAGADPDDTATATGGDPAEIPADDDEIPAEDLPGFAEEPDTQGASPVEAELGDDGQGDLAPEDL